MGLDAAPFKMFGTTIAPGAFFYFGPTENLYPIIMSYYDLSNFGNNDAADAIIVNPGYKVVTYNAAGYGSIIGTYDNTDGSENTTSFNITVNVVSSVKLYYLGTELSGSLSTVSNTHSPTSSSSAPTTGTGKIVPYTLKDSTIPAFCPVYMTGAYASYPIFHSISDFSDYGMNNSDDYYLVAPHFTIIVYGSADYLNQARKYENNTDDWKIFLTPSDVNNEGTSCKLYYYGTEITNT